MNPYATTPVVIRSMKRETPRVISYELERVDRKPFRFTPGQIIAVSLPGVGESAVAPSESFTSPSRFDISVQKVGRVTTKLHDVRVGDRIGVRGPYGRGFRIDEVKKRSLLIIAGGLGIIPLRSLLRHLTNNFCNVHEKAIQLFFGAKTYDDLMYKDEFPAWKKCLQLEVTLSKPYPDTNRGWRSHAGMLSSVFRKTEPICDGLAILCGPPVMFRVMIPQVFELGFNPMNVFVSLERRMQCIGQGTCQHCGFGSLTVCQDGPVFRLSDLLSVPQFEAYRCA